MRLSSNNCIAFCPSMRVSSGAAARSTRRLLGVMALFSLKRQLPVRLGAIPQIKIDHVLIRDAYFIGNGLEIINGILVDTDGDLSF